MSYCPSHGDHDDPGCAECDADRQATRAYEQGRADERAAIVAWLRRKFAEFNGGLVKGAYEQAAAEIERVEHLPKGKP